MQDEPLRIGSIARPRYSDVIPNFGVQYNGAVVVSLSPFILVSRDTNMKWTTLDRSDYIHDKMAPDDMVTLCMRRLSDESTLELFDAVSNIIKLDDASDWDIQLVLYQLNMRLKSEELHSRILKERATVLQQLIRKMDEVVG